MERGKVERNGEKRNKNILTPFSSCFKWKFQLGYFKRKLLSVVKIFRCKLPERSKEGFSSLREATVSENFYVYLQKEKAKTTKEHAILQKNDVLKTGTTWGNPINHNACIQDLTVQFKGKVALGPHHGAGSSEILYMKMEQRSTLSLESILKNVSEFGFKPGGAFCTLQIPSIHSSNQKQNFSPQNFSDCSRKHHFCPSE